MQPKTEKRPYLEGFLINYRHIAWSDKGYSHFSRITPIDRNRDISGVLDGPDVHLENSRGEVIRERKKARRYFPGGRRLFYWDDLDMAYFANYAMWNYLTLPALLMRKDIVWKEIEAGLLEAIFPEEISAVKIKNDDQHSELISSDGHWIRWHPDKNSGNRAVKDVSNWEYLR